MSRIHTAIEIRAPLASVFEYATTPGIWPAWHPASRSVSGAIDHPLEPGEQLTEEIDAAGRRWRATWTVREREAPRRWVIDGVAEGGGTATLTYVLAPAGEGTRFERELVYRMPSLWLGFLDLLVIRRRMTAESEEALRRLKAVLEGQPG